MGWLNINGNWIGRHSGKSWSSYWKSQVPELATLDDNLTTKLTETEIINLGTMLKSIKDGLGITTLDEDGDVMILLAGETEESSCKNLIKNDFHVTNHGATFDVHEGFTGNAVDQYMEVDFIASTDAQRFLQNDCCVIVLSRAQTASGTKTIIGAYNNGVPYRGIVLNTYISTGYVRFGIQYARNSSAINFASTIDDRRGYWAMNRLEATVAKLYRNKVEIATDSSHTSTALSDKKPLLLASLITDLISHYSDEQIAFLYMGKGKTPTEMNVIIDAVEAYMTANGKSLFFLVAEHTMKASEADKHYGFSTTFFLENRMYCIYRDGESHNSYDGVAMMMYSDDDGLTWSEPVIVYTGEELITEAVLGDDALAAPDVRDFKILKLNNGTILLFGFVSIGHNDPDIDSRVELTSKSFCITIPYSGNMIDLDSKSISLLTSNYEYYSGGCVFHNNIVYATTYRAGVSLYKSADFGSTWDYVTKIFSADLPLTANESSLAIVNGIMYCVGRGFLTKGTLATSSDFGEIWGNYTEIEKRIDGHTNIVLPDNQILAWGRGLDDDLSIFKLNGLVAGTPISLKNCNHADIGYGSVLKHNDYYYFTYSDGPLRDGSTDWANTGIYFKKIPANMIEV